MADFAQPLTQPSSVNMHTDPHPPKEFTHQMWWSVRSALHSIGAPFSTTRSDPRCAVFRMALAMNLTQDNYHHQLSSIGQQGGRLFAERVCTVLLPGGREDVLFQRIQRLQDAGYGGITSDLHALRVYGNRVDHDELMDLKPDEKPDVVHRMYRVAGVVLEQMRRQYPPEPIGSSDVKNWGEEQVCAWLREQAIKDEVAQLLLEEEVCLFE
jgi:hypothetical protein